MISITLADMIDAVRWMIIIGILAGCTYKRTMLDVRRRISWRQFLKQIGIGMAAGMAVIAVIAAEAWGYIPAGGGAAAARTIQYAGNVVFNLLVMVSLMQGIYTCYPKKGAGMVLAALWIIVPYTGIATSLDLAAVLTVAVFIILFRRENRRSQK